MSNKYLPFIDWLWSKRNVEKYFRITVLTDSNGDESLPSPPLSIIEADDLFSFLEERGLASEKKNIETDLYRLSTVEEWKWKELKRELKKPNWRRHWIWIKLCNSIFWILALVISGAIGATVKASVSELFNYYVKKKYSNAQTYKSNGGNKQKNPSDTNNRSGDVAIPKT